MRQEHIDNTLWLIALVSFFALGFVIGRDARKQADKDHRARVPQLRSTASKFAHCPNCGAAFICTADHAEETR